MALVKVFCVSDRHNGWYNSNISCVLFVTNFSEDGWWEAENASGKKGVVPKTLLKVRILIYFRMKFNWRAY